MALEGDSLFRVRPGHSPLHRIPAAVKILAVFAGGFLVFRLPAAGAACFGSGLAACGLICGVRARDLARDLAPGFVYAVFLWMADLVAVAFGASGGVWPPRPATVLFAARLLAALVLSSLLFRTTSTLALREGVDRLVPRGGFALALGLMLGFIPRIFGVRAGLVRAWRARGGRAGLRRLAALLPPLLALSLRRAGETGQALRARGPAADIR